MLDPGQSYFTGREHLVGTRETGIEKWFIRINAHCRRRGGDGRAFGWGRPAEQYLCWHALRRARRPRCSHLTGWQRWLCQPLTLIVLVVPHCRFLDDVGCREAAWREIDFGCHAAGLIRGVIWHASGWPLIGLSVAGKTPGRQLLASTVQQRKGGEKRVPGRSRRPGSLALASLNRACRNLVPTFPQRSPPSLLTTADCGGLRSAPDCRPRRTYLHLSYSYASPFGPALLVTQDPLRSLIGSKYCVAASP